MVNMELATAKQRQADLKQELSAYQKKADELEKLYKAQDQLLGNKLFKTQFGNNSAINDLLGFWLEQSFGYLMCLAEDFSSIKRLLLAAIF